MPLVLALLLAGCGLMPRMTDPQGRTSPVPGETRLTGLASAGQSTPDRTPSPAPTSASELAAPGATGSVPGVAGAQGEPASTLVAPSSGQVPIALEAGLYRCELKRRVTVRRVASDRQSIVIHWLGKDTALQSVRSPSGALRFENASAGLVWIAIATKSMLLDSRIGRTLANECRI